MLGDGVVASFLKPPAGGLPVRLRAWTSKRNAQPWAIRKRREEQSLSQEKLALMIGSSKSHIWRIETGRVGVGIDDLSRIAEALGTRVRDLVSF